MKPTVGADPRPAEPHSNLLASPVLELGQGGGFQPPVGLRDPSKQLISKESDLVLALP